MRSMNTFYADEHGVIHFKRVYENDKKYAFLFQDKPLPRSGRSKKSDKPNETKEA